LFQNQDDKLDAFDAFTLGPESVGRVGVPRVPRWSHGAGYESGEGSALELALAKIAEGRAYGSLAVVRSPNSLWSGTAGFSTHTNRIAQIEDQIWIGGITEVFVGAVILSLVARSQLALTTTVHECIPEIAPSTLPATIGDLLWHSNGAGELEWHDRAQGGRGNYLVRRNVRVHQVTLQTLSTNLAKAQLLTDAPSSFHYSRANVLLLKTIAERITRAPIAELMDDLVLIPLRLNNTSYETTHMGGGVRIGSGLQTVKRLIEQYRGKRLANVSVDCAMVSTVADLTVFFGALLSGRLLPSQLTSLMKKKYAMNRTGVGLSRFPAPCGIAWCSLGQMPGYLTTVIVSDDGETVVASSARVPQPRRGIKCVTYTDLLHFASFAFCSTT
jgi:D-alanyl-D-alanine carboxypeptidase